MSIANGTTHYGYPQVQLTDRPTFADFNPAFADIDGKLYGLITGAAADEQTIADLGTAVGNLTTELGSVSETATAAKDKADASEEAITLLSGQVSQNTTKLGTKIDSNAIAEPYDTTATYAVGDVVTYQGQRYRCTTAVLVAEPFDATKWVGEDVETVLTELDSNFGTLKFRNNEGTPQYSLDGGTTWVNFKSPVGTMSITANGTYDVTDYASANVNVPDPYRNFSKLSQALATNVITKASGTKVIIAHLDTNVQEDVVLFPDTGMFISGGNVGMLSGGELILPDVGNWGTIKVTVSGSTVTFYAYSNTSAPITNYSLWKIYCLG